MQYFYGLSDSHFFAYIMYMFAYIQGPFCNQLNLRLRLNRVPIKYNMYKEYQTLKGKNGKYNELNANFGL